jgi:hypothetical protein
MSIHDDYKSADEVELEVEEARARLRMTLEEIRSRLSPGQMLDQALDYARASGGAEFSRNLGRQVRDNPLPIALIGAGISWLMTAGRMDHHGSGDRVLSGDRMAGEQHRGPAARVASAASSAYRGVADTASGVGGSVAGAGERASRLAHDARERISGIGETAAVYAESAADTVSRVQHGVSGSVRRIIEEQPLVLGAVGLAIGALLGASFPATRAENRAFGRVTDREKDQAADRARQGLDEAKRTAGDVVAETTRALDERGSPSPSIGERMGAAAASSRSDPAAERARGGNGERGDPALRQSETAAGRSTAPPRVPG